MLAIAALPGSAHPSLVEVPPPDSVADGQILCRTLQLGVCGTDREILASKRPVVPPGASFLVLGHECLAEVVEVGPGVTDYRPGDLVVPVVRRALPAAQRRADMLPLGQFTERGIFYEHGFSQPRWLDRPEYVVPVPRALAEVAVFAEPVAVVEKGINEADLLQRARLGELAWPAGGPRALVTGLGPIAFAAVLACRRRNWPTTVYGRDADTTQRARLVQDLGAQYIAADHWNNEPADVERDGFDLVLECTGSDEVLVTVATAMASCGIMVWLGSTRQPRPQPLNLALVMREAVIRNHLHLGTVNAALRDFRDALTTLAWCPPELMQRIFTSRVGLQDALWHYEHREPQGIKCVVEM